MQSSIADIRLRLFILLGRAFVIVLSLSVIFSLASFSYFLAGPSNRLSLPIMSALEGYYAGRGSWDGVAAAIDASQQPAPPDWILLDAQGRIVLDHRQAGVPADAGQSYTVADGAGLFDLRVQGQKVGTFVVPSFSLAARVGSIRGVLLPVGVISILLAFFLAVTAILLLRRFVNPLAEVIYASHAVTQGKLNTRISSKGQGDIRGLVDSFNEMAVTLERDDRERRDMLADIAHELRTPLSIIRGRLEGIVDGIYSANGSQVSLALQQTYLLERLVDDLRILTLAETRQLHFEKKSVDLRALAQRAVELFSAQSLEKDIELKLEEAVGDFHVEIDPQRTEQAIGNLISNALHYVPTGGRAWLTLERSGDKICLSVSDNGPGVAAEDIPYLFDRFWRSDRSRSRTTGGTGLGLAIARQLVEAQGGGIVARIRPEGGLEIEIAFPRS